MNYRFSLAQNGPESGAGNSLVFVIMTSIQSISPLNPCGLDFRLHEGCEVKAQTPVLISNLKNLDISNTTMQIEKTCGHCQARSYFIWSVQLVK
ncbi:hypothetical protein COW36_16840 [bacterium (Candidatus Blackallbacteria) CG17_big_fil_post_rev_8_21_14_2_50_48_46]|uniref:Uncharacterized protein n=1 Tax=bacterium (Candidatus Blackallbacteria) CG17_big_fil_post_rev_8_21_14_2_50_48_46 TaxID=2014261 RepID=A0A2M7G1H5_9BACT|nr:MAG: hypothetical protein COW64_22340 [bacterium (Candidatus Blackallbacteria) CG18_big_fil_WC_8_21_14_2_50_49_26]PIW15543.1 MAG: hypothetical protein COW36_16840 [bacterium (Candidatus Blackallbacteria) CG17_big_fil_post_rev_8_21_14_2_50_48_46]PIW50285.1 MAG: hypothetical protein COW20_03105 [bacterium (Candidatus Blackallbacteria) CG13_big_fil_rev_8_21_14_2_50_49_14]